MPHASLFHIDAVETILTIPRKQWSIWRANACKASINHILFLLLFDFYWKTKLPLNQYNDNKENRFKIRNSPWKSIFGNHFFFLLRVFLSFYYATWNEKSKYPLDINSICFTSKNNIIILLCK